MDGAESLQDVRKDLAELLKEEIEIKTGPALREEHAEELFLNATGAQVEDSEASISVKWSVPPYSISAMFQKPTSPVNVDEEGLGMDNVIDMDEKDIQQLGEYTEERQQRGLARREQHKEEEEEGNLFVLGSDGSSPPALTT